MWMTLTINLDARIYRVWTRETDMLRIRRYQECWQVYRRKLYGHIEVVATCDSEVAARSYIQRHG